MSRKWVSTGSSPSLLLLRSTPRTAAHHHTPMMIGVPFVYDVFAAAGYIVLVWCGSHALVTVRFGPWTMERLHHLSMDPWRPSPGPQMAFRDASWKRQSSDLISRSSNSALINRQTREQGRQAVAQAGQETFSTYFASKQGIRNPTVRRHAGIPPISPRFCFVTGQSLGKAD